MPLYTAQTTLKMVSGVTADSVVNRLHFGGLNISTDPAAIAALVVSFYNNLFNVYSSDVAQSGHMTKIYDTVAPMPNYPLLENQWGFSSAPTGGPMPHELAIVLSFQGQQESGVPQARKRGRVYIGPVKSTTVDNGGFIASASIAQVVAAGQGLLGAASDADPLTWVVYSKTGDLETPVTDGWVDNEFDVQRRRGKKATARNAWT